MIGMIDVIDGVPYPNLYAGSCTVPDIVRKEFRDPRATLYLVLAYTSNTL